MSPWAAPRPCLAPGCRELVKGGGRCSTHERKRDQERGTSHQRGYGAKWRAYRLRFLQAHPLCAPCLAEGRTTAATVVNHKVAHKGDPELFWDPANHEPNCRPHHDRITSEGDFGR